MQRAYDSVGGFVSKCVLTVYPVYPVYHVYLIYRYVQGDVVDEVDGYMHDNAHTTS